MGESDGGSGVVEGGSGVSLSEDGGLGNGLDVVVSDNWGSLNVLDDGLTSNGGWDSVWDWPGNMDWGGDLNNLLDRLDDVIGDIDETGHVVGLLDDVGLLLDGHDGGVDLGGAAESAWDGDVQVWDGRLQDFGGVSGDVGGGAQVNLLADDGGCLLDGGDGCADDSGRAVGSGHGDGGGNGDGAVRGGGQELSGRSSAASSGEKCEDDQWVHFE